MTISDWIMIAAVFSGPLIAVQLTRYLDNKNEKRGRKLNIFKTLMATRLYFTHWDHVNALNLIDVEFDKDKAKEKDVIDAWKAYLDFLSITQKIDPAIWNDRQITLFVDMLHKMAIVLDYDFDKTHLKNSSYAPIAHGTLEGQQKIIREYVIEVLEGRRSIPMDVVKFPFQNENH